MTADPSYEDVETHADLLEYSRAYCREARRERAVSVRFDLVDWEISTRAKRRAAAVKRPKLPNATVGEPYDWGSVDGADGRPLPCTVSLTWAAFESFEKAEWESTLRHELIHVEQYQRDGTTDHGPAFRERAAELETDVHCRTFTEPKHRLACGECGETVARRYRDCKLVRDHEQYYSECCGAALERS